MILLVSTASIASLAPRNSTPDVGSNRKVLKLATPLNLSGPRMASVNRKEEREKVRFFRIYGRQPIMNLKDALGETDATEVCRKLCSRMSR